MNIFEILEKAKTKGSKRYGIYSNEVNYPTPLERIQIERLGYEISTQCSDDHDYVLLFVDFYPPKPIPIKEKTITVTMTVRYQGHKFNEKDFKKKLLNKMYDLSSGYKILNCELEK